MFKPNETNMTMGLAARGRARDSAFETLMGSTDSEIVYQARKHGINAVPGKSRLDLCIRITEAKYPEFDGPMVDHSTPVAPTETPAFMQAMPGDPELYRDMVAPEERVDQVPGDVASVRQIGGFIPSEFDAEERVFVACLDADGSYVKLPVQDVIKLTGFDEDFRRQAMVLSVEIPGWWLHVQYVQEMLVEINLAVLTGEPENTLDVINKYTAEQGWAEMHGEVVEQRMSAEPTPSDAPTEQIELLGTNQQADLDRMRRSLDEPTTPQHQVHWVNNNPQP